ncbi:MAG: hypothetical protein ACLQU3_08800, partial [Limisphaerales bacterium]
VAGSDSQTRQNIQSQCEHSHRQIYTKLNDDAGAASCFSTTNYNSSPFADTLVSFCSHRDSFGL